MADARSERSDVAGETTRQPGQARQAGPDKRAQSVRARSAVGAPNPQDRIFWFGLACAALLHAALILGVTRSSPRQMGETSGRPDGISVVLVDEADLASKNTFAEEGSPGSPLAAAPPAPSAPDAPPATDETKKAAQPMDKKAHEPASPAEPAAKPGEADKEGQQKVATWPKEPQALDRLPPPNQTAKQGKGPSKAEQQPGPLEHLPPPALPPVPPLQLTLPETPIVPGGRTASFSRPAGATRSGENDEFGRGVIRALRKTMPHAGALPGRVTVRFLLSENGDLVELRLVRSAGNPLLDQAVMFAVKQTSFPFPPVRSTPTDRTFLVTFIYN